MGIVKIVSGEPAVKNDSSHADGDLTRDEIMLLQSFPGHESDDCERAEVGCELAMSRGLICNVPYELYDLPELTEVLSLETWNLCLTEDDRFRLAAYLPDMDQHDFCTTMKELFSGDAVFFGSPLKSMFHRLNSGFYSPEVSQARESLMILEKRRHYHFLKLYHDGIIRKLTSVDNLLRSSDMSANFGGMVPMSHNWGSVNCFPRVGLSSSSLPIIVKDDAAAFAPFKRAKIMDGTLTTQCSTSQNGTAHIAKLVELNSSESQIIHSSRQNSCKPPKGILKIRSDYAYRTDGGEGVHHIPGMVLVNQVGMQSSSVCTPSHAFAKDVHGFSENLSSPIGTISSRSSPLQWKGAPKTYALMAEIPLGVQMTVPDEPRAIYPSVPLRGFYHPAANHSLPYSSEACYTRELPHMQNLLKNFGRQKSIVHEISPDPYTGVSDSYQMNGYTTMHSSRNAESNSQMLNAGARVYPPYNNFAEQLETVRKYHNGMKVANQFPCTYSRRRLHKRNLDTAESVRSSTMVEDTVSPSVLASMANMKATAIEL